MATEDPLFTPELREGSFSNGFSFSNKKPSEVLVHDSISSSNNNNNNNNNDINNDDYDDDNNNNCRRHQQSLNQRNPNQTELLASLSSAGSTTPGILELKVKETGGDLIELGGIQVVEKLVVAAELEAKPKLEEVVVVGAEAKVKAETEAEEVADAEVHTQAEIQADVYTQTEAVAEAEAEFYTQAKVEADVESLTVQLDMAGKEEHVSEREDGNSQSKHDQGVEVVERHKITGEEVKQRDQDGSEHHDIQYSEKNQNESRCLQLHQHQLQKLQPQPQQPEQLEQPQQTQVNKNFPSDDSLATGKHDSRLGQDELKNASSPTTPLEPFEMHKAKVVHIDDGDDTHDLGHGHHHDHNHDHTRDRGLSRLFSSEQPLVSRDITSPSPLQTPTHHHTEERDLSNLTDALDRNAGRKSTSTIILDDRKDDVSLSRNSSRAPKPPVHQQSMRRASMPVHNLVSGVDSSTSNRLSPNGSQSPADSKLDSENEPDHCSIRERTLVMTGQALEKEYKVSERVNRRIMVQRALSKRSAAVQAPSEATTAAIVPAVVVPIHKTTTRVAAKKFVEKRMAQMHFDPEKQSELTDEQKLAFVHRIATKRQSRKDGFPEIDVSILAHERKIIEEQKQSDNTSMSIPSISTHEQDVTTEEEKQLEDMFTNFRSISTYERSFTGEERPSEVTNIRLMSMPTHEEKITEPENPTKDTFTNIPLNSMDEQRQVGTGDITDQLGDDSDEDSEPVEPSSNPEQIHVLQERVLSRETSSVSTPVMVRSSEPNLGILSPQGTPAMPKLNLDGYDDPEKMMIALKEENQRLKAELATANTELVVLRAKLQQNTKKRWTWKSSLSTSKTLPSREILAQEVQHLKQLSAHLYEELSKYEGKESSQDGR